MLRLRTSKHNIAGQIHLYLNLTASTSTLDANLGDLPVRISDLEMGPILSVETCDSPLTLPEMQ